MIELIHASGRKVAALCGSPAQARKHAAADVDIIIAQGGEGGGHCGEVGSIVLWPQVVKEVAPRPVLAAGAIPRARVLASLRNTCTPASSVSNTISDNNSTRRRARFSAATNASVSRYVAWT
jgi:hypothetical protein